MSSMTNSNLEWVAGAVVVSALILGIIAVASLGVWDLLRQYKGISLSVTASTWLARFFVRHPLAAFCSGLTIGILAGHFMWGQIVKVCING